jgi:hypothetical protein
MKIPYATRDRVLPISIVPMNCDGLWLKFEMIFALRIFCFAFSSKYNLLDETKAISTPEKKAENTMETIIPMIWLL